VVSRLWDLGIAPDGAAVKALFSLLDRMEPFTAAQAQIAADLRPRTRHAGLSLGDRACLSLALELGAEVFTADAAWLRVDLACRIHLIR
jgi:PIN domain nuclease of toxin-antitoxin system